MASQNPFQYYNNEENHGDYAYESLENIVYNFLNMYTGDETKLGKVERSKVIAWAKKGLQQFNFSALKEVKAVELELGSTLDIILPPDFVNYVRISWVHPVTGQLMPMSRNDKLPLATAYLQDNNADVLFDDLGEILEGTTQFEHINNNLPVSNSVQVLNCGISCNGCQYASSGCLNTPFYNLDTSKNFNGYFNIDKRQGKIHFTSESALRIIMLEYISDGLEYSNEDDIKINKLAEMALYNWINWNLLNVKLGAQDYVTKQAKRDYDTSYRNSKIKLMNLSVSELIHTVNGRNRWFK